MYKCKKMLVCELMVGFKSPLGRAHLLPSLSSQHKADSSVGANNVTSNELTHQTLNA